MHLNYITSNMLDNGGSLSRTPEHTHVVSFWYVPNSTDYHNAEIQKVYFTSLVQAAEAAAKINYPPECPNVYTVEFEDWINRRR